MNVIMKIVVCFCLSLPVEFALYPTCNVCCFLSMCLFPLPMGPLSSLWASIFLLPSTFRSCDWIESVTQSVTNQSWVIQSRMSYRCASNALLPQSLSLEICGTFEKWIVVAHNSGLKFVKEFALQRLAHKISDHLLRRTIFNSNIFLFHLVCEEKISNVQSSGSTARAALSIRLQQNGAFVVLV